MKKIAYLLCFVTMLTSASPGQEQVGVSTTVLAKTTSSWDGTPLPSYPKNTPEITILRITLQPGVALPWHRHPVINAGVLVSGELTVTTDDKKSVHLKAGDGLVEVVNRWHFGKNTGKDPAVILVFYAGAQDVPVTVRKE